MSEPAAAGPVGPAAALPMDQPCRAPAATVAPV